MLIVFWSGYINRKQNASTITKDLYNHICAIIFQMKELIRGNNNLMSPEQVYLVIIAGRWERLRNFFTTIFLSLGIS